MTENDNSVNITNPDARKTSILANISLWFGGICIVLFVAVEMAGPFRIEFTNDRLLLLAMALACFSIPFGLVVSVFVLFTHKRKTGVLHAILGVFLSMLALFMILPRLASPPFPAHRLICGTNLGGLGKAISFYAKEYNDTLPSSQWCDNLIKYADVSPKTFICKSSGAKLGQSSYAFNKNLIGRKLSEINPNTVMLFETRPGWNQVGGPEILSYRSHKGEGFNILYADGHVAFEESFVKSPLAAVSF